MMTYLDGAQAAGRRALAAMSCPGLRTTRLVQTVGDCSLYLVTSSWMSSRQVGVGQQLTGRSHPRRTMRQPRDTGSSPLSASSAPRKRRGSQPPTSR